MGLQECIPYNMVINDCRNCVDVIVKLGSFILLYSSSCAILEKNLYLLDDITGMR